MERIEIGDTRHIEIHGGMVSIPSFPMRHERLLIMRELFADTGSIYLHCDWRLEAHLRNVL